MTKCQISSGLSHHTPHPSWQSAAKQHDKQQHIHSQPSRRKLSFNSKLVCHGTTAAAGIQFLHNGGSSLLHWNRHLYVPWHQRAEESTSDQSRKKASFFKVKFWSDCCSSQVCKTKRFHHAGLVFLHQQQQSHGGRAEVHASDLFASSISYCLESGHAYAIPMDYVPPWTTHLSHIIRLWLGGSSPNNLQPTKAINA